MRMTQESKRPRIDNLGNAKAVGWLLPVAVVEAIGDKFP
jgi:hypothetical protein